MTGSPTGSTWRKEKVMKLTDLLYKISEDVTVWIAEDPAKSEGIYFGAAGSVLLKVAKNYEVVSIYPERYPAIHNFTGITIIVKKRSNE